ncbi:MULTISPECIES: D-ribose pyranase [unclassified Iodobacter]|uniref:D-ribose pyranase n=1 Tax=unclassified Iodobacter TaxID=235634 RepID=UPI0025F7DEBA|nr:MULTISPECIES: D-ribose pyranase [unclassified Iodobacter]MDW5417837.1 D-ribose pyranase [Iodobacter sp. CM08]
MKKHGILNSDIARVLAQLGHTDSIVIADCGLPIPDHVERIDLALKLGQPSFVDTLQEILTDMQVERAVFATECLATNPTVAAQAEAMQSSGISIDFVSHEEFKQLCHKAKAVIRTGEATPYANIILHSGVIF